MRHDVRVADEVRSSARAPGKPQDDVPAAAQPFTHLGVPHAEHYRRVLRIFARAKEPRLGRRARAGGVGSAIRGGFVALQVRWQPARPETDRPRRGIRRGIPIGRLAAECCGDAHALDDGRPAGTLALSAVRALAGLPFAADVSADSRRAVWACAGVHLDDLSSLVLCLGLPGDKPYRSWPGAGAARGNGTAGDAHPQAAALPR